MAHFLGVWLLGASFLKAILDYDLQGLNPQQEKEALQSAGFDTWLLTPEKVAVEGYKKVSMKATTLDNIPVRVEQYSLGQSQLKSVFFWKIRLITSLGDDRRFHLPDYAFYNKKAGALVTRDDSPIYSNESFKTLDKGIGEISAYKFRIFAKRLQKIIIDLETREAVFLKITPQEIGTTGDHITRPIIISFENIFPIKKYWGFDDIRNTPTGPIKEQKSHWLINMCKEAWYAVISQSPPKPCRAKTPSEEFKLIYEEKESKRPVTYLFDTLGNTYYLIQAQQYWNKISFISLLKELMLLRAPGEGWNAFEEQLNRIYSELEVGKADVSSWKLVSELISLLPDPPAKRRHSRTSSQSDTASDAKL